MRAAVTDLGLDDTVLELLKVALLQAVRGLSLDDAAELRLSGGTAEMLTFSWMTPGTSQVLHTMAVPRGAYDGIVADPGPWAALRARIAGPMFIDLKRTLAGATEEPPPGMEFTAPRP